MMQIVDFLPERMDPIVAQVEPCSALRVAWAGADLKRYRFDAAAAINRAYRETLILCEVEDPDTVVDRATAAMVRKALSEAAARAWALHDRQSPSGPSLTEIGRDAGRHILAEIVLARAPALAEAGGCCREEICLTLVDRALEELDRLRSGVALACAEAAGDVLWEFIEALAAPPRSVSGWSRLRQHLTNFARTAVADG